jgi:hypothetical protein
LSIVKGIFSILLRSAQLLHLFIDGYILLVDINNVNYHKKFFIPNKNDEEFSEGQNLTEEYQKNYKLNDPCNAVYFLIIFLDL